jgi:hypothetical protein
MSVLTTGESPHPPRKCAGTGLERPSGHARIKSYSETCLLEQANLERHLSRMAYNHSEYRDTRYSAKRPEQLRARYKAHNLSFPVRNLANKQLARGFVFTPERLSKLSNNYRVPTANIKNIYTY